MHIHACSSGGGIAARYYVLQHEVLDPGDVLGVNPVLAGAPHEVLIHARGCV